MSTDEQIDPRGIQRNRPEHVDALASTVISVLRDRQAVSHEGLRQFVLDHLMRAVLSKSAFLPDALLVELRGYRLTVDAIIDLYVPAVARQLGQMWVDDSISFADVTIGSMRLQSLISEASAVSVIDIKPGGTLLHALVLVPQGEQHFLGASVVAGQLRRMGCEVDMSFDEDMGTLTARLMHGVPDLILMSCARRETLRSITNTVQVIRNAVSEPPVLAVGGALKLNSEAVLEKTGVDIVTSNAGEAVAFCGRRRRPAPPL
ncbi:MAG: B12-binding domain-containing protein [Roseobacter sp.]